MNVEILKPTGIRGLTKFNGDRVEISDTDAINLIRRGRARAVKTAKQESDANRVQTAPEPEVEESTSKRKFLNRKGKR
jgi:hypothetical protein